MKREEAIRIINDERVKYNIWETPHDISEEEWEEAFCMAVEVLENYVEVVRCKDCKYQRRKWHDDKRFQDGGYFIVGCMRNGDPFVMHTVDGHDTDFCSYGERADK